MNSEVFEKENKAFIDRFVTILQDKGYSKIPYDVVLKFLFKFAL
jgi:hypothetical protein